MKKVLITLLLAVSTMSLATPINRLYIPSNSKWLFHVDFDAFRDSKMGSLIEQEITAAHQKKIEGLATLLGTDLTQDLYGFTLCGPNADDTKAAALIYAKYDKEKLLALLGMNEKYAESSYQEQTIYHWFDEKQSRDQVGAFATEELIVISQSKDTVTAMLDLIKEPSKSIANAQNNALTGLSEAPEGAIMIAAADGLSELTEDKDHAAILKNSKLMAVIIGENNGNMKLNIDLIAENAEAATKIEQVVRGMQAFMTLSNTQQPEINSLIQATTLQRNDNQLALTFQYPSAKLFEMIKAKHNIDIWTAAATGDTKAIMLQLATGTDINAKEPAGGSTPLIIAAITGQTEAAAFLIEEGADLNAKNNDGTTALHAAAFFGHPETVKLLLDNGANVNVRNTRSETAYDTVAAKWSPELAGVYKLVGGILQMELDLERIKEVRPEIADLLRENN